MFYDFLFSVEPKVIFILSLFFIIIVIIIIHTMKVTEEIHMSL